MVNDELLKIIDKWSVDQLDDYIDELEVRVANTQELLKEVRVIRRKKLGRKSTPESGTRGGK